MVNSPNNIRLKNVVSIEGFITLFVIIGFFGYMSYAMDGPINMLNTLMYTAYDLLMSTIFYILAITVLAGALSAILSEFGVVALVNKILSKVMKPVYNLPGASALGVVTTFLSDNPAILTLAKDKGFRNYFKRYQLPALTNLGTSFGMGLIVITWMISLSTSEKSFFGATMVGLVGAVIGSIISVRLMLHFSKKYFGTDEDPKNIGEAEYDILNYREIKQGSIFQRLIDSILEGGKSGVEMGLAIIPGVISICTIVLMLTLNSKAGTGVEGVFEGIAYEGINLLPKIGEFFNFILQPLFGFSSPEAIAFPLTSVGAVGAALGLLKTFTWVQGNDIAVFTAMGMCWSGYLSTHVAMMDNLNYRQLTGKAILSHTIGGLAAGIAANLIYQIIF